MWEARKDEHQTAFDYWLHVVKLLSDSSPVIVVLNKVDERIKMLDENSLQRSFKNIVTFHKVSATEKIGINGLIENIKNEITKLSHVGDKLPKVWANIKKELENLDKNHISYSEYKNICNQFNQTELQTQIVELKKAPTDEDKKSILEKIKEFLVGYGVPVSLHSSC
ncbi:hypothetical protein GMMP15_530006 [Candidatus Magnetomoraceae bacterium gMMP-15]